MSHTPEPWVLSESPYGAIVSDASADIRKNWCLSTADTGRQYSNELAVANARRIVACVNFCAGVSIEKLENSRCGEYQQVILKERDTYRDLCAELLNALKMTYEYHAPGYHDCTDNGLPECEWCESKKAITKAEKILNPEQQS